MWLQNLVWRSLPRCRRADAEDKAPQIARKERRRGEYENTRAAASQLPNLFPTDVHVSPTAPPHNTQLVIMGDLHKLFAQSREGNSILHAAILVRSRTITALSAMR